MVEQLKLQELQAIVDELELEAGDRRVRGELIDAIVRSKRAKPQEFLGWLSRDRLKEICLGLALDETGREKSVLIERITGEEHDELTVGDTDDTADDQEVLLKQLLGTALTITSPGNAWPTMGRLHIGDLTREVQIYARTISGSSRGNALERRFQNPSAAHVIAEPSGRLALLFGLWLEQGRERSVIVAFDTARRVAKATRFSLFMPLPLLEEAADTGFAFHENNRHERIYAFRPESLGRYINILIEEGSFLASEPRLVETPAIARTTTKPNETIDPTSTSDRLYIRPRVGMYASFARLNYKPWFALAEFLDNSIQSFMRHRDELVAAGHEGPLVIDVVLDNHELSITDRAGGIAWKDFPRAFSPAAAPDDSTGLSEFGLGMKAAACWFARRWSVRTSALGEAVERTVTFDIPEISREGIENLPIESRSSRESDHFTVVTMQDLRQPVRGRTLTKIKDHLSSIYRVLMEEGIVKIRVTTAGRAEDLVFEQPDLLVAPDFRHPDLPAKRWYQTFSVKLGERRVTGWAGILKDGSYGKAGFSVFRRRRLIDGSVGETYKPHSLFGSPGSFWSLRLIGELFVDGFDVTHTKDGIQWGGYEDDVLDAIRSQIDTPDLPLLQQANGYRARKTADSLPRSFGKEALDGTELVLQQPATAAALRDDLLLGTSEPVEPAPAAPVQEILRSREIKLHVTQNGMPWTIHLELVRDPVAPFYATALEERDGEDIITVRLNLDHDFSVAYINENEEALQPMLRFIAALALGEKLARQSGVRNVGAVRNRANDVLSAMVGNSRGQQRE